MGWEPTEKEGEVGKVSSHAPVTLCAGAHEESVQRDILLLSQAEAAWAETR